MKKIFLSYLSLFFLFLGSCNNSLEPTETKNEWRKIELPDEGSVYSFFGSLNNFLLVGTVSHIMKSDDFGKSWDTVYQTPYSINTFLKGKDTLFALSHFNDYFSLNDGESWSPLNYNLSPEPRNDTVVASDGTMYRMQSVSDGELAQPTVIFESTDQGNSWKDIFPYKHYVYSIYIDNADRLYLGINGWEWDEEMKSFNATSGSKAIIYYLND